MQVTPLYLFFCSMYTETTSSSKQLVYMSCSFCYSGIRYQLLQQDGRVYSKQLSTDTHDYFTGGTAGNGSGRSPDSHATLPTNPVNESINVFTQRIN